jgi:hypothetical protein
MALMRPVEIKIERLNQLGGTSVLLSCEGVRCEKCGRISEAKRSIGLYFDYRPAVAGAAMQLNGYCRCDRIRCSIGSAYQRKHRITFRK